MSRPTGRHRVPGHAGKVPPELVPLSLCSLTARCDGRGDPALQAAPLHLLGQFQEGDVGRRVFTHPHDRFALPLFVPCRTLPAGPQDFLTASTPRLLGCPNVSICKKKNETRGHWATEETGVGNEDVPRGGAREPPKRGARARAAAPGSCGAASRAGHPFRAAALPRWLRGNLCVSRGPAVLPPTGAPPGLSASGLRYCSQREPVPSPS